MFIPKDDAEITMDAAECNGCEACVMACPNISAMIFAGAKVSHLGMLPQGKPEAARRVRAMTKAIIMKGLAIVAIIMNVKQFAPGHQLRFIAKKLNREFLRVSFR